MHGALKFLFLSASAAALTSCRQDAKPISNTDPCSLTIWSGRGVSNVCEIGMTLAQLKRTTPGMSTHGAYDNTWSIDRLKASRFALLPNLGAIATLDTDKRVSRLEFYAQPHTTELIPGLAVQLPFCGKIENAVSFGQGPVQRKAVEVVFGEVLEATNAVEAAEMHMKGQNYCYALKPSVQELTYPARGVTFIVVSDTVTSIQVYPPMKQKSERHTPIVKKAMP